MCARSHSRELVAVHSRRFVGTLRSVRRTVVVVVLVLVVGGAVWALWPSTTWLPSFCGPIGRVVGSDVRTVMSYQSQNQGVTVTPAERRLIANLRSDVDESVTHAPTSALRRELLRYQRELRGNPSLIQVDNAFSAFDQKARTQLRACGIRPIP
jgi:hypothetical protein